MRKIIKQWQFYTLGHDEYRKCMDNTFINNLFRLRQLNIAVAVFGFCFMLFPFLVENNFFKASIYLLLSVIAMFISFFVTHKINQHKQGKHISNLFIYILISIYYANVILFGIYLGVWANPGKLAVSFMGIVMCALFLFNISPVFSLCHTLAAMAAFMAASIFVKTSADWHLDITNTLFAGCIAQFFGWQITMFRLSLASTASKLEDERNKYYDQSTVDELTGLKNRRDFMQTFKRAISNYRQADNFLCVAIIDIDFFKNYNDHYGHQKGDECLRSVGKALKELQESMSVYAARVGGEEFALIWFEKEAANANNVASRLNQMINSLNIPHEESKAAPHVTVSIGIQIVRCGANNDMHVLYDLADKALYAAKKNGRNRAVINL